jgi:hypothetical protein
MSSARDTHIKIQVKSLPFSLYRDFQRSLMTIERLNSNSECSSESSQSRLNVITILLLSCTVSI